MNLIDADEEYPDCICPFCEKEYKLVLDKDEYILCGRWIVRCSFCGNKFEVVHVVDIFNYVEKPTMADLYRYESKKQCPQ